MVFCSLKEAYGSEFNSAEASYTPPPCNSGEFNPIDPYSPNSPRAPADSSSNNILDKIQFLERQIETFVSGTGAPVVSTVLMPSQTRMENVLHAVLLSLCVSLVVQNIM